MKIFQYHSHLNGYEWLLVHHRDVWRDFVQAIEDVHVYDCKTKVSKEKTMAGKTPHSPGEVERQLSRSFGKLGWTQSGTSYWVTDYDDPIRKIPQMGSKAQERETQAAGLQPRALNNNTDSLKGRVAIEIQFGRSVLDVYPPFAKHLASYVYDQIDLGIEVLPMKSMKDHMSSGPGNYEGALYDLARQGRGVPSVPLILVGIAP